MAGVKGRSGRSARRLTELQDIYRERINAPLILKHLTDHVLGNNKMEASQVTAALGLLRKVLPDLSASEVTSEVTHNYVARMPQVPETADEWQKQHSPTIQ